MGAGKFFSMHVQLLSFVWLGSRITQYFLWEISPVLSSGTEASNVSGLAARTACGDDCG